MKKPPDKKPKGRNKKKKPSLKHNWFADIYTNFSPTNKNAWLWLFITIFTALFTGEHLVNSVITESILNLRITNTVHLSERPLWFIFVVLINIILFLFSLGYIWHFLKQRVKFK